MPKRKEVKAVKQKAKRKGEGSAAPFPIIGIGASAGGLPALETFFSAMPKERDLGMAFVVIQHLAPDHKSMLAELISRYTRIKVYEAEEGMEVEPNCIYIIPPNRDMAFLNGALQLLEPATARGVRLPIDFFFRSLALDRKEKAIGIILSGTGSDGTQGMGSIKAEGGMTIAQTPDSAEYDGMPQSAIAAGVVDFTLPPEEMAEKLISYTEHAFIPIQIEEYTPLVKDGNALQKIFILLRSQTGHDFSQYKPNTVMRRIERRMALHQIDLPELYVSYLQQNPHEIDALFHELLIGVTNFFRDPEAFASLKEQLPKLFENKAKGSTVRVWSTGCSTGEEAYSIAILLHEYLQESKDDYKIQVFATDIDARAIARSRAGVYPAGIAADISPERLTRFFTAESDGSTFRIHKTIRDMLIFSEQNIIKDPPFSKLDLISCRNLLIYLDSALQKRLIPLFHYSLNPGGILFLGNSETIGEFSDLFTVLDSKSKLYQRKEVVNPIHRLGIDRHHLSSRIEHPVFHLPGMKSDAPANPTLKILTEQALLNQLISAAVLVDEHGDILYLHGRTGMYLELPSGEAVVNNILKMAREGLLRGLTMALHKATITKEAVHTLGLRVKTNGHFTIVNLTICPVTPGPALMPEAPFYLVILEEAYTAAEGGGEASAVLASHGGDSDAAARIEMLTQELHAQEDYLQTANEKLETSNEELRASNEEMQSMNEELQSTNEELETSKEELQSVNEELSTVNAELQLKVLDLSRSNNDMNNLLAGTGIGTVFVDYHLCILRFTPAATKIINLIQGDLGRPVGHIVSNLVGYDKLTDDVQNVLDTLVPKELEVQTTEGKWYILRIQPYRTLDNIIEGAVITFVNISETVLMRKKLEEANDKLQRLAVVVRDANDAITVQDLDGKISAWNPGAVKMYGWSEAQALGMNVRERIPKVLHDEAMMKVQKLKEIERLDPYKTKRLTKKGEIKEVWVTATALVDTRGTMYAIATTEREIRPYE